MYKEFINLELSKNYYFNVVEYVYLEDWLKFNLRFKKVDNELPSSHVCTEIYNVNYHKSEDSLDTLLIKDEGFGDRFINWIERVSKI